jgi:uncharacterized protein YPO0396
MSEMTSKSIGFRFKYLEIWNWGTFDRDIWHIDNNGLNSLLVGENGSGKSTIVDAITTLLVPPSKITFNKAASGKGKERDFLSYVKGNYKQEQNESGTKGTSISHRYKDKNNATWTVLIGCFYNAGYDSYVTLAQVFWIHDEKLHKLFLISKSPLTIQEYFSNIEDVPSLRKKLSKNPDIQIFGDKFKDYSHEFRRAMGIQNDNAIDLFFRTISMKEVEDLSGFVKELMLEKTDVKEQLDILKKQFEDLTQAHNAVEKVRRQKDILEPIAVDNVLYDELGEKITQTQNLIECIPGYFADKKIELLKESSEACTLKLMAIRNAINQYDLDISQIEASRRQIDKSIDDNGGKRLEQIDSLIEQYKNSAKTKRGRFDSYKTLADICEIKPPLSEKAFHGNVETLTSKEKVFSEDEEKLRELVGTIKANKANNASKIKDLRDQLELLRTKESNIDPRYLKARYEVVKEFALNEQDIPFVGELIQVRKSEDAWEGAIERLLRTFAISLIVPARLYPEVSKFINNRHGGIKLEYYNVPLHFTAKEIELVNNVAADKLEIKPGSEYETWLQNEIDRRCNLQCVNSIQDYQRLDNVITKEGQYKIGRQRNVKDDRYKIDDRSNYVLGWSTKEKIISVNKKLVELEAIDKEYSNTLNDLDGQIQNCKLILDSIVKLKVYNNWFELNFQDDLQEIEKLNKEKNLIENANDILRTLRGQANKIEKELQIKRDERDKKIGEQTTNENKINSNNDAIDYCTGISNSVPLLEKDKFYPLLNELFKDKAWTIKAIDEEQSLSLKKKNSEKEKLKGDQSKIAERMVSNMTSFNKEFVSESVDLVAEATRRKEYCDLYYEIIKNGLPELVGKFKSELKEKTMNNLVTFHNYLDSKYKVIADKIKIINDQLSAIEYKNGTYIEIAAVPTDDASIDQFQKQLKACFANIAGISDAYTEERFLEVKKLLDEFKSNETAKIAWTERVTDVRNWRIYNAIEKFKIDGTVKEFYSGSNAKSGGQKERLAYTILATSLAYQFGLIQNESKSKSFRFVVIDEAFSKSDDESTQFGLKLFEKLHLQLLVVTPMQKISIIENYVNHVHYVSKNSEDISQVRNLTIEEFRENRDLFLSKQYQLKPKSV